ncbi:MAG TPA: PAS domain S-box protein, partial [Bacteroidales bacterium]|nr:PAS domain S-box protein [Bacteroidales bacterium]
MKEVFRSHNEDLEKTMIFRDDMNDTILRLLAENIEDVFWVEDRNRTLYINHTFEKVWGIPCNEILGSTQCLFDSVHPGDKDKIQDIITKKNFAADQSFDFDFRIIRPDNLVRWINARTMPVKNNKGEVIRRVGIARDISEQTKIHEETALLAEMLNLAPALIAIYDENGRCLFANQKTFEVHGYPAEEFLNLRLDEVNVPESADLISKGINALKEQGLAVFEVEHIKKDGSPILLEVVAKTVQWKGCFAILSMATDISERKQMFLELIREKERAQDN